MFSSETQFCLLQVDWKVISNVFNTVHIAIEGDYSPSNKISILVGVKIPRKNTIGQQERMRQRESFINFRLIQGIIKMSDAVGKTRENEEAKKTYILESL